MMDYSHKQDTSDRANGIPLETPLAKGEVPMSANSINSERADDVHGSTHYKVYPIRWWILALFCFANFLNAYFWISFAAISNYAETYYDVSSAAVNGFSIIYMVGYFPGAVVSIFSSEQFGAKKSLIAGTIGNLICTIVRYIAAFIPTDNYGRYIMTLVGQLFGALSQPFFMNLPATIAMKWFPSHQREIATSIAALINPLGNAAGSVIPSVMVSKPGELPHSLLLQLCLAVVSALLMIMFMKERPDSPPSAGAYMRELEEEGLQTTDVPKEDKPEKEALLQPPINKKPQSRGTEVLKHVLDNCMVLLKQRNFLLLFIGFSMGLGVFNALITLIEQIVSPCGYNSTDAGIFSACLVVSGLVGAAIAGIILEKTGAFLEVLKLGALIACAGVCTVLLLLRPHMFPYLVTGFLVMGLAILPLLPISMENAAEMTYPVHEDTSTALLIGGGQLTGIAFSLVMPKLSERNCDTVLTPLALFLVCVISVVLVCFMLIGKDYRRMKAEDDYIATHKTS